MWLAIDHTVRFAPSIRPPIEPVVSTANTTSIWRVPVTGVDAPSRGGWGSLPRAHGDSPAARAIVATAAVGIP